MYIITNFILENNINAKIVHVGLCAVNGLPYAIVLSSVLQVNKYLVVDKCGINRQREIEMYPIFMINNESYVTGVLSNVSSFSKCSLRLFMVNMMFVINDRVQNMMNIVWISSFVWVVVHGEAIVDSLEGYNHRKTLQFQRTKIYPRAELAI